MNAVLVIERIIKTSYKNIRLSNTLQADLLEVNFLALFGALSLRYSEMGAPPILIPKSYHDALLTGTTGLSHMQVRSNALCLN